MNCVQWLHRFRSRDLLPTLCLCTEVPLGLLSEKGATCKFDTGEHPSFISFGISIFGPVLNQWKLFLVVPRVPGKIHTSAPNKTRKQGHVSRLTPTSVVGSRKHCRPSAVASRTEPSVSFFFFFSLSLSLYTPGTQLTPVFDRKIPYFGCLVVQNRGHSGSRYIYIYKL